MRRITVALGVGLAIGAPLGGCSGGGSQIQIGPPPARVTTGPLAGPLCQGDQCTCATSAAQAGFAEAPRKRFEIRLASAQELWVALPGHALYKSPERAEACFYVDLAPGQHPLTLRASNPDGVSAALEVHELGATAKTRYDTFRFACGHPGVCGFGELDALKATYAQVTKNLHDACGSTKIKGITWDHGKAPDGEHPSELVVRATLDVYKFLPDKASGDATCGAGEGARSRDYGKDHGDGEPPAQPPTTDTPPAP